MKTNETVGIAALFKEFRLRAPCPPGQENIYRGRYEMVEERIRADERRKIAQEKNTSEFQWSEK
jgi:hypothetical protein